MTTAEYTRTTTVTKQVEVPAPTPVPATTESLWDLRQKYRSGLIVLGELFAVLDRFLDGTKKDTKNTKDK